MMIYNLQRGDLLFHILVDIFFLLLSFLTISLFPFFCCVLIPLSNLSIITVVVVTVAIFPTTAGGGGRGWEGWSNKAFTDPEMVNGQHDEESCDKWTEWNGARTGVITCSNRAFWTTFTLLGVESTCQYHAVEDDDHYVVYSFIAERCHIESGTLSKWWLCYRVGWQ